MEAVYLCDYVRTPFGRYAGTLATIRPDDLAAVTLRALQARNASTDWARLDEVYLGCANQAGEDSRNVARMATLIAGLPITVPACTVNRLCGSGLEALGAAARAIATNEAELVIAGGVESMTRAPLVMLKPESGYAREAQLCDSTIGWRFTHPGLRDAFGAESMAQTAENVAQLRGISRDAQDAYALRSQQRYERARSEGWPEREIVPVHVAKGRGTHEITADEHPRAATTIEDLARLRPIVTPSGTVTAGNASGLNDGAAALLLANERAIVTHGLRPLARILGSATIGVHPGTMGLGPVPAIRRLLERLDMRLDAFDVIEINEAFAAQVVAVLRDLSLADDAAHVNPNGGAIAVGHPLGASGARLAGTAALELRRRRGRYALCSLCIGVGQGIALALEAA